MGRLIVIVFASFGAYIVFPFLPILGQYAGKTIIVLQEHQFSTNFVFAILIAILSATVGR